MSTTLSTLRPEQGIPSVASPLVDCPWCWIHLHPNTHFPEQVSSTICSAHYQWMLAQAEQRRAQRSEVQHAR